MLTRLSLFLLLWAYSSQWYQLSSTVVLAKNIVSLLRPNPVFLYSTRLYSASKSDDTKGTGQSVQPVQPVLDSDESSAHLKLTKNFGGSDEKPEETSEEVSTTQTNATSNVFILQYVVEETGEVAVATLKDAGWEVLDHFAIHKFGRNLSLTPGYRRREVSVDLNDQVAVNAVVALWTEQKFLGRSKEFPLHLVNKSPVAVEESVEQFVRSHVRRLKAIKKEPRGVSVVFQSFLRARNISGQSLSYYAYNPSQSGVESMARLKQFLLWFRSEFPYYYDKCSQCSHGGGNPCYGLVYPSSSESEGLAARTELYLCSQCNQTTRFPRFNDVTRVLRTRRGRCGEYSVLMMRLLQALGYRARWTVDKADHVWTEVLLPRGDDSTDQEWVHVDPCEASIDEPLIYQGWGKNQTYIFAYSVDPDDASKIDAEDVTARYTTDSEGMSRRRVADGMNQTYIDTLLQEAVHELRNELK